MRYLINNLRRKLKSSGYGGYQYTFEKNSSRVLILGTRIFIFLFLSKLKIKETFADRIKQNAVYTKNEVLTSDNVNDQAFKKKSFEVFKKYFGNTSKINENIYFLHCSIK